MNERNRKVVFNHPFSCTSGVTRLWDDDNNILGLPGPCLFELTHVSLTSCKRQCNFTIRPRNYCIYSQLYSKVSLFLPPSPFFSRFFSISFRLSPLSFIWFCSFQGFFPLSLFFNSIPQCSSGSSDQFTISVNHHQSFDCPTQFYDTCISPFNEQKETKIDKEIQVTVT